MIEGVVKYTEVELQKFAEQKKRSRKNNNQQKVWNYRVVKLNRKLQFMSQTRQEKLLIKILKSENYNDDAIQYMLRLGSYLQSPL